MVNENYGKTCPKKGQEVWTRCPNPLILLVRPARFELATYGFVVRRSIQAELRAH